MSGSRSGHAYVHLHAVITAGLMAAVGYGIGGKSFVSAFVPQPSSIASRQTGVGYAPSSRYPRKALSRQTVMTVTSTNVQEAELKTPPKDFTFSPWGIWKQFTTPGNSPTTQASKGYQDIISKTGGVWRSRCLGLIPTNMFDSLLTTTYLTRVESTGKLIASWPKSVQSLVGEKSHTGNLTDIELDTVRGIYTDSIGPTAILSVKPLVDLSMVKTFEDLGRYAETGEEFEMMSVIEDLTLSAIALTFAGNIEPDEVEILRNGFAVMTPALMSLPITLPWPLSRTPLAKMLPFNFGYAMEVRKEVFRVVDTIVERRRKWFFADGVKREPECVLDTIFLRQAEQEAQGGAKGGDADLSDKQYILDNIIAALFAGQGTTSAVMVRMMQFLSTPGSEDVVERVRQELETTELRVASEGAGGLFARFPLVRSLSLESARLYPPVFGVFRKPIEDLTFNGFKIPQGSSVFWSYLPSLKSEEHYPDPERICPFRFASNPKSKSASAASGPRSAEEPGQPKPPMFGFGRHYCPGRELSKLEMILFLKKYLAEFDGRLVEGQNLGGTFFDGQPVDRMKMTVKRRAPSPVA